MTGIQLTPEQKAEIVRFLSNSIGKRVESALHGDSLDSLKATMDKLHQEAQETIVQVAKDILKDEDNLQKFHSLFKRIVRLSWHGMMMTLLRQDYRNKFGPKQRVSQATNAENEEENEEERERTKEEKEAEKKLQEKFKV